MALTSRNAALAILCKPDGALIEVLHDEGGSVPSPSPGVSLASIVVPQAVRKVRRFLRTVVTHEFALGWDMKLALSDWGAPLFFSGCITNRGLVIIGTKEPPSLALLSHALAKIARDHRDLSMPTFQESSARSLSEEKPKHRPQKSLTRVTTANPAAVSPEQVRLLDVSAHDLRNAVGGILAASQYLVEDAAPKLEEHQLTLLRSIESSSQLALRLVEELFLIPVATSGKLQLQFQPTDITWLVDQSVALHRPLAERKKIRLEIKADREVPVVSVDPTMMTQAIDGLLLDAITRSHADSRIEVHVTVRAGEAILSMRDDAPGISVGDLRSLFGQSSGGRGHRALVEGPTVLTLKSVKRIVESHRGRIQVESDFGKGSIYTVTLPLLGGVNVGQSTATYRAGSPSADPGPSDRESDQ